jgi:hypothetical protein
MSYKFSTLQEDYMTRNYSPSMENAIRALILCVDDGEEFPDACWKIAKRAGFMVSELRDAYDRVTAL